MLYAVVMQLLLDKPRVQLHLIDGRHDTAVLAQLLQMMNLEIADADCPHAAFFIQALQRTPGVFIFILARPMNQVQVDYIQS
ncbi:hypothetical protein D3C80_2013620 [compost metagenome]